jgi:cation-transporting ATPase 13A2
MERDDNSSEWNAERGREDESGPSTTLGRLASFFGASKHRDGDDENRSRSRRTSMASSRRSGAARSSSPIPTDSGSENWGYTSHGDEDDADTYSQVSDRSNEASYTSSLADDTSLPPQSRPSSPTIPLLPSDGIFGDPVSHAHLDEPILDFPECASSSRQTIILPDEDLSIRFTCYSSDPFRNALWWIACVLSFGVLGLVGRWIPSVWVRWSGKETAFSDAKAGSWLVVEVISTRRFPAELMIP